MHSERLVVRLARLGWSRQLLLAEALAGIAVATLAVRFLPFRRAVRLGSRRLDPATAVAAEACGDAVWSVTAVAARVPWRAVCFQQGLALQWMLRRRGIDARLHYGVGQGDEGSLLAHVWVTVGDAILIGGDGAPGVRGVAVYP